MPAFQYSFIFTICSKWLNLGCSKQKSKRLLNAKNGTDSNHIQAISHRALSCRQNTLPLRAERPNHNRHENDETLRRDSAPTLRPPCGQAILPLDYRINDSLSSNRDVPQRGWRNKRRPLYDRIYKRSQRSPRHYPRRLFHVRTRKHHSCLIIASRCRNWNKTIFSWRWNFWPTPLLDAFLLWRRRDSTLDRPYNTIDIPIIIHSSF